MSRETLASLLAQPESSSLEFFDRLDLTATDDQAKLLREVFALANSAASWPSYLVLGIDPKSKTITGCPNVAEAQVRKLVDEYCKPPIFFSFGLFDSQDKPVVIIEIPASRLRPHVLKKALCYQDPIDGCWAPIEENQVLVRQGTTTTAATLVEILAMVQDRDNEATARAKIMFQLEHIGQALESLGQELDKVARQVNEGLSPNAQ